MTLLLLELRVPPGLHGEAQLRQALAPISWRLLVYLMSFITLGILWVGQQTQLTHLARSDRDLTWILAVLFAVTVMPFPTHLLNEYSDYRTSLRCYWANILILGFTLYLSWGYATRAGLVKQDISPSVPPAICRRLLIAQSLYAFGALLCVVNTYWSIAFIVLVQLGYAIGLPFRRNK